MTRRVAFALLAALAIGAVACSNGDGDDTTEEPPTVDPPTSTSTTTTTSTTTAPPSTTTTLPPPDFGAAAIRLTEVAALDAPTALTGRPGDDALYVAEKTGRVRAIRGGSVDPTPVADLSGEVSGGSEQGLLGLAFSADGSRLYVDYTDRSGDTHVLEYAMAGGHADASSRREVLRVAQPFSNHNGGELQTGPDGLLYVALGDGGSGGDPQGNGQNPGTLLGTILRIDPIAASPYGVPADNPFVGDAGTRGEVWVYGLRNPWRFSFDRATGDLWIGDVGQDSIEEIDYRPADAAAASNFGWNAFEGTQTFSGADAPGAVPPIFEYPTQSGCAVTGGYVYRGGAIRDLTGAYLFGDYCNGEIRALLQESGALAAERSLGVSVSNLSSFGEDEAGELYALSLDGPVYRIDPA